MPGDTWISALEGGVSLLPKGKHPKGRRTGRRGQGRVGGQSAEARNGLRGRGWESGDLRATAWSGGCRPGGLPHGYLTPRKASLQPLAQAGPGLGKTRGAYLSRLPRPQSFLGAGLWEHDRDLAPGSHKAVGRWPGQQSRSWDRYWSLWSQEQPHARKGVLLGMVDQGRAQGQLIP